MAVIEIVPLAFIDRAVPFTAAWPDRPPARQDGTIASVRTARPGVVFVAIALSGAAAGRDRETALPCAGRRRTRPDRRLRLGDRARGADARTRLPRGLPRCLGQAGPPGHSREPHGGAAHYPFKKHATHMRGSP
ncbi:hypothetical protein [Burkholderia plantarii]|uniref:hypothetical protein n=1 Tax=Burkholderia plantarii TaxID=41899 RepID=UPI0006D89B38|nr:hypothetical protein [Burkholderia plantarii]GLZ22169.1 hypothetical protein Bpla01_56980 [Burkholderia plantarii]